MSVSRMHSIGIAWGPMALAPAARGQNLTLFLILIAAVIMVVFWRPLLKVGIAAVIIGLVFLLVTGLLDIVHGLHALIP